MANWSHRWIGFTNGLKSPEPGPRADPVEIWFFEKIQTLLRRDSVRLAFPLKTICGVDASYSGRKVTAAAVLYEEGEEIQSEYCRGHVSFPYISGLLYLREGPFAAAAVNRLTTRPDLVCFDAHGMAHPRRAGLASICGLVLGTPTIGIAKSLLTGSVVSSSPRMGSIFDRGELVGFTTSIPGRRRYWSPGYSVSLAALGEIIRKYAEICVAAVTAADKLSRESRWNQEH